MVFKENCLATVPAKFGWIFYSRCKIKKNCFLVATTLPTLPIMANFPWLCQ
jgi:hypothetical protein